MTSHGRGQLFINDQKMNQVCAVDVTVGVDNANQMTVMFHPDEIEVSGEFDVTTIESTSRELAPGKPGDYPAMVDLANAGNPWAIDMLAREWYNAQHKE